VAGMHFQCCVTEDQPQLQLFRRAQRACGPSGKEQGGTGWLTGWRDPPLARSKEGKASPLLLHGNTQKLRLPGGQAMLIRHVRAQNQQ